MSKHKFPKHDKAFVKKILSTPGVKREYTKLKDEFDLLDAMLSARKAVGMTQAQVAKAMGVNTSVVGRLETSGGKRNHSPTLATLHRYAKALGAQLQIKFLINTKARTV